MLVKKEEIKERWKINFDKPFNGSDTRDWSELSNPIEDRNQRFVKKSRMTEAKDPLRRMKMGKP